jgi:hypothetical protein
MGSKNIAWQGGHPMDHTHVEQSYSDEVMTQIPEAEQMLRAMGIERSHTRLQVQAEASSLDTETMMAALDLKLRRHKPQMSPDKLN